MSPEPPTLAENEPGAAMGAGIAGALISSGAKSISIFMRAGATSWASSSSSSSPPAQVKVEARSKRSARLEVGRMVSVYPASASALTPRAPHLERFLAFFLSCFSLMVSLGLLLLPGLV
jgi:hypothetical protein